MYRGVQPVVGGQGRGHMEVGDENGNTVEMNTGNMTPTSVLTVISKDTGLKTVHRRMALCRLQLLQSEECPAICSHSSPPQLTAWRLGSHQRSQTPSLETKAIPGPVPGSADH
ncbi:uncharacterized protein LOC121193645 isoform X2 [Toxotes jaculatrix]|uniref:uncharacterized protein LOC121193645 isoform X2 n=1 Tax=Toxotes jaculatrix TaxID=941984 RepID=UPI001B3A81D7|nr:uncharacterized protein LOC121193645 isoform X2 [Toxotes jaculatrix]